jgi:hypothetical protein
MRAKYASCDSYRQHSHSPVVTQPGILEGNELQTPMAVVIFGGLLSATALNMLVLPALYTLYGRPSATAPTGGQKITQSLRLEPTLR